MLACRSDATNNVIKRSQTVRCSISEISFLLQTISRHPRPPPSQLLPRPENKHTPFCFVKLKSCLLGYRLYGSWPPPRASTPSVPPADAVTATTAAAAADATPGYPFSLGFLATAAAVVPKLFAFNDRP